MPVLMPELSPEAKLSILDWLMVSGSISLVAGIEWVLLGKPVEIYPARKRP